MPELLNLINAYAGQHNVGSNPFIHAAKENDLLQKVAGASEGLCSKQNATLHRIRAQLAISSCALVSSVMQLILPALLVGIIAGLGAIIFRLLIAMFHNLMFFGHSITTACFIHPKAAGEFWS